MTRPADTKREATYERTSCPESHYWFASWLAHGYTVTCTRCGTRIEPNVTRTVGCRPA